MTNVTPTPEQKKAARYAVRFAVYKGQLHKPDTCEGCEQTFALGDIDAHHHLGYDEANWFDVQWLCKRCHGRTHGGALMITDDQRRAGVATRMERYTPEERSAMSLSRGTPEERSAWVRKGVMIANANRTPEERTALARKAAMSGTSEERRERARRARAAADHGPRKCPTCDNTYGNPGGLATHRGFTGH